MAKLRMRAKSTSTVSFTVKKVPNKPTQNYNFGFKQFVNLAVVFAMVFSLVGNTTFAQGNPNSNPAADLDQCQNGASASPVNCTGSAWANGNANNTNSHYQEGGSIPYRMKLTNLTPGTTYTLVIGYDTKSSGSQAIDYLTTVNRFGTANIVDPCNGAGVSLATCPIPLAGALPSGVNWFAIPAPTVNATPASLGYSGSLDDSALQALTSFNSLSADQKRFVIVGGEIETATLTSPADALTENSSTSSVKLVFTTDSTSTKAIIAWGGHIGSRVDWGFEAGSPVSAGGINGSSYHGRLLGFCSGDISNCTDGGNQDHSLSAGAVLVGELTVVKQVINDNAGNKNSSDFTINVTGNAASPASFSGSSLGTPVQLEPGNYSVAEGAHSGYNVTYSADCSGSIVSGQQKLCIVTNDDAEPTTANLTLVKTITNDNGGSALATAWTLSASGNTNISGATGSANVTNAVVDPGTYSLSESGGPSGYTASDWSCVKNNNAPVSGGSIDLVAGDSATCTINNNDVQPKITVNKIVVNDSETGTAVASDFTLKVGSTVVVNGEQAGVNSGSYTVNESGLSGYTATFTGDCDSNGSIVLSAGDVKTCTITNNDDPLPPPTQGVVKVIKVVNNDNGGNAVVGDVTLKVGDTTVTSGENNNFDPNTYIVSESGATTGYSATFSGDCDSTGSITVEAGKQYVCTITNDDNAGNLIVKKIVSGSDLSPSIFSFSVNNGDAVNFETDGQNNISVNAGTYSIVEQSVNNFTTSYDNCSEVNIALGETQTCTITNTYQAPEQGVNTMFHFMKRICPTYASINGNETADNADATGGKYIQFANYSTSTPHFPTINSPVSPNEIPEDCIPAEGWNFKLDDNSGMGTSALVGPTGVNGNYDVALNDLPSVAKSAITSGGQLWVQEEAKETASFGAIRCYTDALNGDNLEYISFGTDQTSYPTDVYCIAYNVNEVTPPDQCPAPVTQTLVSGITTKTAGFTQINPVADPLNPANYSNGNLNNNAVLANTVIPPWLDPLVNISFNGASWISTTAVHPGDIGGEGISQEDQWRLYETTFTVPAGASVTPVTLYYSADNAVTVYFNGAEIGNTPEVGTYDPVPSPLPEVFSNTYSKTFTPVVGLNKIDFVVRNSLYPITVNPTALIYKATYTQQDSCEQMFTLTLTKNGDGNGTVTGDEGENSSFFCTLTECDPSKEQSPFIRTYASGTVVTLTAQPDANSNFNGSWSGACTGNNPVCVITMTSDQSVNAHFALNSVTPPCVTNCGGGGGGGGGGSGIPVVPPTVTGQVLGTTTVPSITMPPVPQVLGATTLPRTGMPIGFILLSLATTVALLNKKLKLV